MIRLGIMVVQTRPMSTVAVCESESLGFRLGQPLGALAAGYVASTFGVQIAFYTFGVVLIAAVFITRQCSASLRRHELMP
jgi:predicted MFS family arabinose efflux permease